LLILVLSLALVGLWLVLVCLFIGIGSLVLGKGAGLDDGWPAAHAAFLAGAGIVTTSLLVWHLWLGVAWLIAFGSLQRSGPALAVLCGLLACAQPLDHVASFLVHRGPAQALAVLWLRPSQYMTDWSEGYPVVPRQTNSGLTIDVTGRTSFHTPLPNARFFNPNLELRLQDDLGSGFRVRQHPGPPDAGYPVD
jgi:hypothetical protein